MTSAPSGRLTPEEYLRLRGVAESKSGFVDPDIFATPTSSHRYTVITGTLTASSAFQLPR
jgi:hypothetical protein